MVRMTRGIEAYARKVMEGRSNGSPEDREEFVSPNPTDRIMAEVAT
jgi:hypothetical protein